MDELDRMFRRLVQNARAASPEYLARPFELAEIYHTLLPYRLNRRELGMESVQQYDAALMRLLAGERGYLVGDSDMQRAMQEELGQASPDMSAFRAHATALVGFAPDAVRQLERDTLSPARSAAAGVAPRGAPAAARAEAATMPPVAPPAAAGPPAPPPPVIVPMNERVQVASGSAPAAAAPAPAPAPAAAPADTTARAAADGERCPHCGGRLPDGRQIAFCPHCGQNLTVRHCPACSTELEVGWRFCVTCGRNVEEPSPPRP